MRYGSVCSGIEAARMAWHPLGWTPAFFSEIEKFPSAVLAHHYGSNMPGEADASNGVPNHGDMTQFQEWPDHAIDLLVGGTPCQSFSVAGLRAGLADPRGNLMLTYLAIAARYRPRWLVWENVPGVLSSNSGRDFGTFLAGLGELGYGFAYRVLDAQFCRASGYDFAVPQRRRRVFVVGYFGDWRRAAAVLFDATSLRGDSPPSRQAGQGTAHDVAPSLVSSGRGVERGGDTRGQDHVIAVQANSGDVGYCLTASAQQSLDAETETLVAHALRGEGFDASEDGTGRGTPLVPVAEPIVLMERGRNGVPSLETRQDGTANAILTLNGGRRGLGVGAIAHAIQASALRENPDSGPDGVGVQADIAYTVEARSEVQAVAFNARQDPDVWDGHTGPIDTDGSTQAVAFDMRGREGGAQFEGPHETANIRAASGGSSKSYVAESWAVRRLTPKECERLQGFPDNFTSVPFRNKPAADGPRYKALGNSMAVNVMRAIGERIALVDAMEVSDV